MPVVNKSVLLSQFAFHQLHIIYVLRYIFFLIFVTLELCKELSSCTLNLPSFLTSFIAQSPCVLPLPLYKELVFFTAVQSPAHPSDFSSRSLLQGSLCLLEQISLETSGHISWLEAHKSDPSC